MSFNPVSQPVRKLILGTPATNSKSKGPFKTQANARESDLATILNKINGAVTSTQRSDLAPFVNWKGNAEAPIHRWLRYREAYSPNLITKLGLGQNILDPFCGCGSIPIGAAQNGNSSVGLDINPLAVFAAKVKLSPLSRSQLQKVRAFIDHLEIRSFPAWDPPDLAIANKVFEPLILDTLLRIRTANESEFAHDQAIRDFLHLAWIAILEKVGSYFKEGNGIKYRNKKRLKTGYVTRPDGQWQTERFGPDQRQFTIDSFASQVRTMLQDSKVWRKGAWDAQTVIQGNVLEMDGLLVGKQFDSIVFSPPYANRFDYFESMKVELWFGGFVNSYSAATRFRKESLRSHLGADLGRPYEAVEDVEQLISLMDHEASSWRMGVADLLRGYFDDMRTTLKHCRSMLRRGNCYVVVGNSAFAGVIVPTDVILAKLGMECGFKKAEILVARHLTVSPQQRKKLTNLEENMRESVVVLS